MERQPRPVTIRRLEIVGGKDEDWLLDISCSKGTYVRTLCHDIGAVLGCGGCMSSLRRVQAGQFRLERAYTLEQVIAAAGAGEAERLLLPVDSLFAALPALRVGAAGEKRVRCGNALPTRMSDGDYRLYSESGEFLALVRVRDGEMKTVKSFFEV